MSNTGNQGVFLTPAQLNAMVLMLERATGEKIATVINTAENYKKFFEKDGSFCYRELEIEDESIEALRIAISVLKEMRQQKENPVEPANSSTETE